MNKRPPNIGFGRCAVTGEWGKVANIDLGDMSFDIPDVEAMVPGEPVPTKPVTLQLQLSVSPEGLRHLQTLLNAAPNPIPGMQPDLAYMWAVTYNDGTTLTQFDPDGTERHWGHVNVPKVTELHLLPNPLAATSAGLPSYTLCLKSNLLFCGDDPTPIDFGCPENIPPEAEIVYYRAVNLTFASEVKTDLQRSIGPANNSVLQLIGRKVGGLKGPGPGYVIAVDARGNWRPYEPQE